MRGAVSVTGHPASNGASGGSACCPLAGLTNGGTVPARLSYSTIVAKSLSRVSRLSRRATSVITAARER